MAVSLRGVLRLCLLCATLHVAAWFAPAHAQSPPRSPTSIPSPADSLRLVPAGGVVATDSSLDSLRARLQRAEEAILLVRQQLAAQNASATQTASRARFELSGRVLVNGFSNSRRVNNVDVPQFVRPDTAVGVRQSGLGASIRQTTITGTGFVPRVLGGEFVGDVTVDFFGGQPQPSPGAGPNPGGRHFPLVRLRVARGMLRWRHGEIMAGQDDPLVSPVNPVTVAAIGVPEFGTAGNLWLWLPQLRATLEATLLDDLAGGPLRVGVQGAVLAPNTGDQVGTAGALETDFDGAERTGRPYLQTRLRARWGEEDREGEIGVGLHRGWIAGLVGPIRSSHAVVASALVPLGSWLELRGEAFRGQSLRGLGGGGIAQNFRGPAITQVTAGVPLETTGGWGQVNLRFNELLTVGGGCGIDRPEGPFTDLPAPTQAGFRQRNQICSTHAILRPAGPIVAGFTYRRMRTTYARGAFDNDHLNLTLGYQF